MCASCVDIAATGGQPLRRPAGLRQSRHMRQGRMCESIGLNKAALWFSKTARRTAREVLTSIADLRGRIMRDFGQCDVSNPRQLVAGTRRTAAVGRNDVIRCCLDRWMTNPEGGRCRASAITSSSLVARYSIVGGEHSISLQPVSGEFGAGSRQSAADRLGHAALGV
jgi:hypothetical protein